MVKRRTYADRADYLKMAVIKRRKKIRQMAIDYLGAACILCKYSRCIGALEFHHLEPGKKDFAISADGNTRSWQRVKNEIEKCILICANCHREIHGGITQLPTATSVEK